MAQIIKSLDTITTGYSVFEKDQVLTASQLNSIASYFEDQTRLTRTQLLGVGILCGLRVTLTGRTVRLSKGMGVTTDGDLLSFATGQEYDRFKVYDEKNPRYEPFFKEQEMIPIIELVPKGVTDRRAKPLSQFGESTDQKLNTMVAVLYMESYLYDPDLCAGTDCDNLGQEFRNTPRLLLVDRQYIGMLKPVINTPREAFDIFEEIFIDRPQLASNIKTTEVLYQRYRVSCESINNKLSVQLPKIFPGCASFLSGVFNADPWPEWSRKLEALETEYRRKPSGIQYYYDFLKDVSFTFNQFIDLLYEDSTLCGPSRNAFPKHLILGIPGRSIESDPFRTDLYPSHLTSHTTEIREHILFLAGKIDMLILSFQSPDERKSTIRITPSMSESFSSEESAIPYYYDIDTAHPVHAHWNFNLKRRRKSNWNYSYNAALYDAQGPAANPFSAKLGKFDFFRIEGHLGRNIQQVHSFIEQEIRRLNLPINSRSVMLSDDHSRLFIKPGFVFTDLYKLHNLMRHDVLNQLDEVKRYSGGLKSKVQSSLHLLDQEDQGTFNQVAVGRHNDVSNSVELASAKLMGSYQQYTTANTENDSWKTHVAHAMQHSGTFKGELSIAAKTEFNTPFDSLISNRHIDLLDHLDGLIKIDTQKRHEKLLFSNYINDHPGLEHSAGVLRGGTFVVLYDEQGVVIGDFMLPYMEIDAEKLDLSEPPIGVRPIRPGFVIDSGINLFSPIERKIRVGINDFKNNDLDGLLNLKADGIRATLDGAWNTKFSDQQRDYFSSIRDSFGTMSSALIKRISTDKLTGDIPGINDMVLQDAVKGMRSKRDLLNSYKAKAELITDPDEKQKYIILTATIEDDLANTIGEATQHIANSDLDVTVGTDGFNAMMEVSNALGMLSTDTIVTRTTNSLSQLTGVGRKGSFNLMMNNLLKK